MIQVNENLKVVDGVVKINEKDGPRRFYLQATFPILCKHGEQNCKITTQVIHREC